MLSTTGLFISNVCVCVSHQHYQTNAHRNLIRTWNAHLHWIRPRCVSPRAPRRHYEQISHIRPCSICTNRCLCYAFHWEMVCIFKSKITSENIVNNIAKNAILSKFYFIIHNFQLSRINFVFLRYITKATVYLFHLKLHAYLILQLNISTS